MDKNSSLPLPGVPGMDKPFFQHHSGVTEAPLFSFFNSSASVFSRSTSQLLTGGNLAPQEVMRRAS